MSKKTILGAVLAAAMTVGMTGAASAATVFVGSFDGNDPFPGPLNGSPALAKCDEGAEGVVSPTACSNWADGNAEGDYSNAFDLTYNDDFSFDWSFDASQVTGTANVLAPIWIAVKAGANYLVYQITGGDIFGSVDISGVDKNAISHVSFYDTGVPDIPLPAAVWLMGAGLAGLGFAGRKKKA